MPVSKWIFEFRRYRIGRYGAAFFQKNISAEHIKEHFSYAKKAGRAIDLCKENARRAIDLCKENARRAIDLCKENVRRTKVLL